jgi:RNA polymerase sigma-70 factor, ECF subfamily
LLENPLLRVDQTEDFGIKPDGMGAMDPDEELIRFARLGDEAAFRMLVERYQDRVAATVIGMLGRGPESDDIGQETFIRLFRSLDRIRGESSLGTYLTRIAINLCLDAARRQQKRRFWFRMDDNEEPLPQELIVENSHDIESNERQERVRQAIQTLDPKHRAVVVLRMISGYSTKETAQLLMIPAGTVLSRLARAQDKLRRILRPLIDD